MPRHFNAVVLVISVAISFLPAYVIAQQSKTPPSAPVPAQILAAKKVFISNAGGDEPSSEDIQFNGGPDRAYNQFYGAIKKMGRYEIVGAPADADLWFEIRCTVLYAETAVAGGNTNGPKVFDPQLRLVIRDPKTNAVLWGFTKHAEWAIWQANRDKNFDRAMDRVVQAVQELNSLSTTEDGKK